MILPLAFLALTGCRAIYAEPEVSGSPVIKELLPDLPELPAWPDLSWEYRDGRYSLSEADVDKLLDYRENKIPQYQAEIDLFKKRLTVIVNHL